MDSEAECCGREGCQRSCDRKTKSLESFDIETIKMHTTISLTLIIITPLGETRGGRCGGAGQFNVCVPPLGRVGCWECCWRSCGRKIKIVRNVLTFEGHNNQTYNIYPPAPGEAGREVARESPKRKGT